MTLGAFAIQISRGLKSLLQLTIDSPHQPNCDVTELYGSFLISLWLTSLYTNSGFLYFPPQTSKHNNHEQIN
ncbi:unnamed protein product [Allacma fusca]|uniref:Uncharacterized protein n=1 Tax=Allacma fusca TaxID=39272 RepID=A0A8J2KVM9_9HEXA|nr:unnamed protein product [Allacma fusca]